MTSLTDKFTALEGQLNDDADVNHSDNLSIVSQLEDVKTSLANIDADILLIKSLIGSLSSQVDPYACCTPGSIVVPPTSPTTHPIDEDRCKRVQAFLHAMHQLTGVIGAATDSGIFWSPSIIISGISEVISTLITGGTVPLPSLPEATNIAAKAISYGVDNIGRGDSLQAQFDSISTGMITPLYGATSPASTQGVYASLVSGSGLPSDEQLLISSLGYNALFSYYFDPSSTPDLSGYSGTACGSGICAITSCVTLPSTYGFIGSEDNYYIQYSPMYASDSWFMGCDLFGFTVEILTSGGGQHIHVEAYTSPGVVEGLYSLLPSDGATLINHHGIAFRISTWGESGVGLPFTVRICPPA
jgi:hypothetical protein